jgi:hypothetical protein
MADNTMAKGEQDKQRQTIQWLKDNRTNNDRQYNGYRTKGQTMKDNTMAKEQQEKQRQTIQ